MPTKLQKISRGEFFRFSRWVCGAAIILSNVAGFAQTPPDADLYYRRTHAGEWPPAGINPSDHSGETTNVMAAGTSLPPMIIRPKIILDNGVDPANLGKGDWIWQMPTTITHLGLAAGNVQGVIDYEKNLGVKWITVKCGDGGSIWSQFNADLITRAHAAGLKIFGWAYAYGNNASHYGSGSSQSANINGEINVALNALALGADGFIIDAETEYETNPTRVADATLYASTIKSNYPTRFLAHAPFPYINSHSGFPYIQFGVQCDAVMPQDYWGAIGISPQTMVVNMNTQWRNWQNGLTGSNTNAIKPIIPIGQSYAPVTGAQITAFLYALQTNSPKATVTGYNSVSFWDAQERNADMDAAILANGAPYFSTQPLSLVADTGGTVNLAVTALGTAPLKYQWQFNGTNVPGATTNQLALPSAQLTNAGNYLCIVTNTSGSTTSSIALLIVYPIQTTVFADTFDTNSAANWIVNQSSADTAVAFNFDYSTLGIPSAPHSTGGTTRGVQMKANLALSTVAALSLSPLNQSFSGDYRLHFDGWINVNGPLPGGAGSTEFLTAGIGTGGSQTEWTGGGPAADGFYFSASGDGGVSSTSTTSGDYSGYKGTAWQNAASGIYAAGALDNANAYYQTAFPTGLTAPALQQANYPQQTGALNAGTLGFAWHDIIISRRGSTVNWSVDGVLLATITNATFTANNIFVGFWDPFASLTDNTNLNFGLVDNVRVEVPAVAPVITTDPSPQTVKIGTDVTFTAAVTSLPAPAFQWQFNGTNIMEATNVNLTLMDVQTTNRGNYSVTATNIAGSTTSSNAALALLPPAAAQFQSITVQPGGSLQINFNGDGGWNYTVEVSTNLINWSVLTNLTSTDGTFSFAAGSITNSPQQFYRARTGP